MLKYEKRSLSTPKTEIGKAVCHANLPMEHTAFINTIHSGEI
jgi:hypothetical protein